MYRTLPNGVGMEYFEATVVRLYADETSYKVIMGYRPIDDIVAEEKKHRQELENEMATLRNIHEALGSGAWKLQYNEQGEMTTCQWSDTMRHMLGFTSTEDFSDEFESWMNRLHPDADECNSWILTVDEEKTSGCGTPPGGTIRIDTRELPCDRDGYINIETVVTDTGIGMSEEFLPHLFDSFSRERDTTMAKVAGSGLGMAIVKSLVDLMGGTITVESEPGKGTRFSVTVPHKIADEE